MPTKKTKQFDSQAQNIYGESEGRLDQEVQISIVNEEDSKVKLSFEDSTKWSALDSAYTIKAYFWFRLRLVEHDFGTVGTLDAKKDDDVDLSSLGTYWKNAKWQLIVSGPSSTGFGKFIHAWTEEQFVTSTKGLLSLNGKSIFMLQIGELEAGMTWKVDIDPKGLPVLIISQDLEPLHHDIERQSLAAFLILPEALNYVIEMLIDDFIEGTDIKNQSSWHGKWFKFVTDKLQVTFPFTERPETLTEDVFAKLRTFKDQTRLGFMKLLKQSKFVQDHYRNLEEAV
jgi:hypothetical protein